MKKGLYYFVPLGRERGGFLDHLGLPPDASAGDIGRRQAERRNDIKKAYKTSYKEAKEQQREGLITEEELAAKLGELEQKKTEGLRQLNELKREHDRVQAEKRQLSAQGHKPEDTSWLPICPVTGEDSEAFWSHVVSPRVLPKLSPEFAAEVERHWVPSDSGPSKRPKHPQGQPAGASIFGKPRAPSLSDICDLATERDLANLLCADAIWLRLRGTNRAYWERMIRKWAEETNTLSPRLGTEPESPDLLKESPLFPSLCRVPNGTVDRLEKEPIADREEPRRAGDREEHIDVHKLLAAMLKDASRGEGAQGDGESAQTKNGGRAAPSLDLMKMLKALGDTDMAEASGQKQRSGGKR